MLYAKLMHPFRDMSSSSMVFHDKYYEVEKVSMGESVTDIYLKGLPWKLNSVVFEFYDESLQPHNIYLDEKYNPYLKLLKKEK